MGGFLSLFIYIYLWVFSDWLDLSLVYSIHLYSHISNSVDAHTLLIWVQIYDVCESWYAASTHVRIQLYGFSLIRFGVVVLFLLAPTHNQKS